MTSLQDPPERPGPTAPTAAPNAFIVGAPKSGTTALGTWLGAHPEVFVPRKELSHFAPDLEFRTRKGERLVVGRQEYLAWFAAHGGQRWRIDRSVFYLYSRRAAAEIHRFDPGARIIVLLRHPVEQMYSEHSEMLYQGDEDIADFGAALAAEADRIRGRRIPKGCKHVFGLFYRDLARYAGQLDRYLTAFGRDQVHVVIFDDLVADPGATYAGVLDFLGLEPAAAPDFSPVNANKAVRSTTVLRTLRSTSPRLRGLGRLVVPDAEARARLRRRLQALNTSRRPRPPLDPELRRALTVEFEPEVARLEALLGRRLPGWRVGAGG